MKIFYGLEYINFEYTSANLDLTKYYINGSVKGCTLDGIPINDYIFKINKENVDRNQYQTILDEFKKKNCIIKPDYYWLLDDLQIQLNNKWLFDKILNDTNLSYIELSEFWVIMKEDLQEEYSDYFLKILNNIEYENCINMLNLTSENILQDKFEEILKLFLEKNMFNIYDEEYYLDIKNEGYYFNNYNFERFWKRRTNMFQKINIEKLIIFLEKNELLSNEISMINIFESILEFTCFDAKIIFKNYLKKIYIDNEKINIILLGYLDMLEGQEKIDLSIYAYAKEMLNHIDINIRENKKREILYLEKKDKIIGSLMGGAIGDALGYQIEFQRGIKERQITRYKDDRGIISDDTQMTLFTVNAIIIGEVKSIRRGTLPNWTEIICDGCIEWLETQSETKQNDMQKKSNMCWIKNIPEINKNRAPGNTCLSALALRKQKNRSKHINDSKGCGAVMRIAPIGLMNCGNLKHVEECSIDVSEITHGHPLSSISSCFCALLIHYILYNSNKFSIEECLQETITYFSENLKQFDYNNKSYFIDLINKAINFSKENFNDVDAIRKLGEGWVAEEALAIAIYSVLKYSNNFEKAVICAVNHDGDSDSTGAIAGNIIGAYLGIDKIPEYYKENIELKDVIIEIANDFAYINFNSDVDDEEWDNKYAQGTNKKYL